MNNTATAEEIIDESMTWDIMSYDETEVFSPSKPRRTDHRRTRWRSDRGEGVISTAIAVLIMAFLGAAMWVGFNTIWNTAEDDIKDQIEIIGSTGS